MVVLVKLGRWLTSRLGFQMAFAHQRPLRCRDSCPSLGSSNRLSTIRRWIHIWRFAIVSHWRETRWWHIMLGLGILENLIEHFMFFWIQLGGQVVFGRLSFKWGWRIQPQSLAGRCDTAGGCSCIARNKGPTLLSSDDISCAQLLF